MRRRLRCRTMSVGVVGASHVALVAGAGKPIDFGTSSQDCPSAHGGAEGCSFPPGCNNWFAGVNDLLGNIIITYLNVLRRPRHTAPTLPIQLSSGSPSPDLESSLGGPGRERHISKMANVEPAECLNDPRKVDYPPARPAVLRSLGTTLSERYLAKLADRSFLNLWSYPNTFIDKKTGGKGDGKRAVRPVGRLR
jgi:hypothetical protein